MGLTLHGSLIPAPAAPVTTAPVTTAPASAVAPVATAPAVVAPAVVAPAAGSAVADLTGGTGLGLRQPFAGSFWTTPLPADVPLDPRSSAMATNLAGQVAAKMKAYGWHVAFNTTTYAPPVFRAGLAAATVTVAGTQCQGKSVGTMAAWSKTLGPVPIPADAKQSAGSDGEIVIWQPSTDTAWELWKASKAADGTWSACWGGKLSHVSTSGGVFAKGYGTAASGLSLMGGIVTPQELASGVIDHALSMAVPVAASRPVLPANRTDGKGDPATTLAEGSRFRLPMDYPEKGTKVQVALIRALKTYGAVVRDQAGSVTFYGENTLAETGASTWQLGQASYTLFDGIDWSKVQVVDPSVDAVPVS